MLIATAVAVSTVVAGCATSGGSTSDVLTAQEVAARYGYDESTATLSPVYVVVPQFKDPKDGYARDLLAAQCLTGVVEYQVVPPGSQSSLIDERTRQLVFNEEVAAQWGYPQLRVPQPADSAVPDDVTITPEVQSAMEKCGKDADARLGQAPERLLNDIEDAGWQAVPGDPAVQSAAERWRTCMAPAGVIDLPDVPSEMPSASVVTEGSQVPDAQGNLVGTPGSVPSDRERQVAVLDAQCLDEVGYDAAVLHARAQAELTAIGQDISGFEASRGGYEAYEKKLDEVITEGG